jgi:Pentapeptide repeats (8 copies)
MKKRWPVEIFENLKALLSGQLLIIVLVFAVFVLSKPILWPGGIGIGTEKSVPITIVEKDKQGNITKTIETTKGDEGKTLWDWLSLLGVPLSLAILGYWLQQIQQKRAEDQTKEEVLQVYFDRLSVLLVDKNLLAIAVKVNTTESEGTESQPKIGATAEERELLDSAVDVIRARTLSILRRFENDPERKTSVMRFLIEADIIRKLKLNLSRANLSHSDLRDADFNGSDLSEANLFNAFLFKANLSNANLFSANLRGAYLFGANLSNAYLSNAYLRGAYLNGAILSNANLRDADLSGADLSSVRKLTTEQLKDARLCKTKLPPGIALDPNRDCKKLGLSEK